MPRTPNLLRDLMAGARPGQWVKNGFVFAAPIFGQRLSQPQFWPAITATFAGFCLMSSAVYYYNDLCDVEEDRRHPGKRHRPVASGRLSRGAAWGAFGGCALAAVGLAAALASLWVVLVLVVYLALSVLYSRWWKHVVVIDVMLLATGFLLRIVGGAAASLVMPSHWLLLCGLSVAIFLALGKRRHELTALGESAGGHRRVLLDYGERFLDAAIASMSAMTVVTYALYTVDDATVARFGSPLLMITVPVVLYGVFRYLYVIYRTQAAGNPAQALLLDPGLLASAVVWVMLCLGVVYLRAWYSPWLLDFPG